MKILRFFAIFCLILSAFSLSGCDDKRLASAKIERVEGANFQYDPFSQEVTFGGAGFFLERYSEDMTKGTQEGYRVGIKMIAPAGVDDFETGTLSMQGKTISGGEFYREVNGQKTGEVILYPVFQKVDDVVEIKVIWQDGVAEQTYKVKILQGTILE